MRKASDKPKVRDILQNTCLVFLKTVKDIRNEGSLRNSRMRGGQEDMTTKCNVLLSWMGSLFCKWGRPPHCLLLCSMLWSLLVQNSKFYTSNCFKYSPKERFLAIYNLVVLHALQNCAHYLLGMGKINCNYKDCRLLLPFGALWPRYSPLGWEQYHLDTELPHLPLLPWEFSALSPLSSDPCVPKPLNSFMLSSHTQNCQSITQINLVYATATSLSSLFPWPAPKSLDLRTTTTTTKDVRENPMKSKWKVKFNNNYLLIPDPQLWQTKRPEAIILSPVSMHRE